MKMPVSLISVFLIFPGLSCSVSHSVRWPGSPLPHFSARIVYVHDGDTVTVAPDPAEFDRTGPEDLPWKPTNHVRLLFIDCMETARNARLVRLISREEQKGHVVSAAKLLAMGEKAGKRVSSLLPPGTLVELEFQGPDHSDMYGRWLAGIFLGPTNLAHLLVSEGLAVVYEGPSRKTEASEWYLRALRECRQNDAVPVPGGQ
jgi:endonuclease YncB( thermonuclease family)